MFYDLEFAGGLGDIFFQCYHGGAYNIIRDLEPEDTARVDVISHNPFAHEIFALHPKAKQIKLRHLGWWHIQLDAEERVKQDLPPRLRNRLLPAKDQFVDWHPTPADWAYLNPLAERCYLVLSACGSEDYKSLTQSTLDDIVNYLLVNTNLNIVLVGRSYVRTDPNCQGRTERVPTQTSSRIINLIDKLTIHGTAKAIENSIGVITTHSACGILGWCMRKPQYLLYPASHYESNIAPKNPYTMWGFGSDYYHTVHNTFENFEIADLRKFLRRLGPTRENFEHHGLERSRCEQMGDGQLLCRILGDALIYAQSDDLSLAPHLAFSGFWESWISVAFARFLEPGMTAIDIGANVGYYTVLMAKSVGPTGTIIAFEPDPTSKELLRKTVLVNGLASQVKIVGCALSDYENPASETLYSKSDFLGSSTLQPQSAPGWTKSEVSTQMLDAWPQQSLHFIKIDAEGSEERIWRGAQSTLKTHRPALAIEFSPCRHYSPGDFWNSLAAYSKPYIVAFDGSIVPASRDAVLNENKDITIWLHGQYHGLPRQWDRK